MPSPNRLGLLRYMSQIRSQEARSHAPDLDPIRFQLVVPVQHHHVQRRFAAAVPDSFKVDFLRPAGGLGRRREVGLAGLRHLGEAGHEDETRVGGFEQEGHECPGEDVSAGDVDIVGFSEGVAERDFAGEEGRVEGGSWEMSGFPVWEIMEREELGAYQRC